MVKFDKQTISICLYTTSPTFALIFFRLTRSKYINQTSSYFIFPTERKIERLEEIMGRA